MTMRWIECLKNAKDKSLDNKEYFEEMYLMYEEEFTFDEAEEIELLIERKCK